MNALHAAANSFRLLQLRGALMVAAHPRFLATGDGLMSRQHRNQGAIHQQQYGQAA
jgi:hypothetical protein